MSIVTTFIRTSASIVLFIFSRDIWQEAVGMVALLTSLAGIIIYCMLREPKEEEEIDRIKQFYFWLILVTGTLVYAALVLWLDLNL